MPSASLWDMRGATLDVKPNCPASQADAFLNRRIQAVTGRFRWSDTIRMGSLVVPDAYSTGSVSLTPGSTDVAGTDTAWPVNDLVNTTLTSDSRDTGFVELSPASMANIQQGMYVVIEMENPSIMEILPIRRIGPDTFTVYCRYQHNLGATVQASTLANRQLSANNYIFTITGILSATSAVMDRPWGGLAVTSNPYVIYLAYCQVTPTAKRPRFAYDALAGNVLNTEQTQDFLNMGDPQRTNTGDPEAMVMMAPHPAGVMQWELYPQQMTGRLINLVYEDGWPRLVNDNDLSPYFLNEEIFIAGAQADALMTKVIPRDGRVDPFFDVNSAQFREGQYQTYLEDAIQQDAGRYQQQLDNWIERVRGVSSYNAMQARPDFSVYNQLGG